MIALPLLLTIFSLFLPASSLSFQNEPDGFRGIAWGTDTSAVTGMVYDSQHTWEAGTTSFFKRKGDELRMGKAILTSIRYGFWEGKLSDVLIETRGRKNWLAFKAACHEKFGRGFKANFYQERYTWSGEKASMVLEYVEKSDIATLLIKSEEMYNQIRSKLREKAKERLP
jgi:hypothetical protein